MKKIIFYILVIASVFTLTACEKQVTEVPPAPAQETPPAAPPAKNNGALSHFKAVPLPPANTYKNPKF